MQENEVNIESVVRDVVEKLKDKSVATSAPVLSGGNLDMDTLLEHSRAAQVRYQQGGLDLRYKVVAAMRAVARENAEMLGNRTCRDLGARRKNSIAARGRRTQIRELATYVVLHHFTRSLRHRERTTVQRTRLGGQVLANVASDRAKGQAARAGLLLEIRRRTEDDLVAARLDAFGKRKHGIDVAAGALGCYS